MTVDTYVDILKVWCTVEKYIKRYFEQKKYNTFHAVWGIICMGNIIGSSVRIISYRKSSGGKFSEWRVSGSEMFGWEMS